MNESFGDDLFSQITEMRERAAGAQAWVDRTSGSQLDSLAVAEYFCKSRHCVLLRIFSTPKGLVYRFPRYKLSPSLNSRTSTPEGREANTRDGENHWVARTGYVDDAVNFALNCDHVQQVVVERDDVRIGTPGSPVIIHV